MKIVIQPGCIACGTCELVAPEVFEVNQQAHVRSDCQCARYAEKIKKAATLCPVGVITIRDGDKE